ncbi:MAG: uridine kinase [Chloroflexi bacterium]|uniref:Uridine kinase n=2 Tax=Candidatus Chlorohelix allophototropha TaxID=3003348 RepID=A0A8T7LZC2_9CHLR|nr:uridine kinase [Chloroflexota bacterium]
MVGRKSAMRNSTPLVIGVAGGTGSGKTTVARHIVENIGISLVVHLQHDSYYKDLSHMPFEERTRVNYDHPDSLDNDLLYQHLLDLRAGKPILMPIYDFVQHNRLSEPVFMEPCPVIVVDGILLFTDKRIRDLMELKIFVDTDADLRFIRRLRRDIKERGRSVDSVIEQYLTTVRIMHQEFVEPTKRYADLIIPEGGFNVPMLLDRIVKLVQTLYDQALGERISPLLERAKFFAGANEPD